MQCIIQINTNVGNVYNIPRLCFSSSFSQWILKLTITDGTYTKQTEAENKVECYKYYIPMQRKWMELVASIFHVLIVIGEAVFPLLLIAKASRFKFKCRICSPNLPKKHFHSESWNDWVWRDLEISLVSSVFPFPPSNLNIKFRTGCSEVCAVTPLKSPIHNPWLFLCKSLKSLVSHAWEPHEVLEGCPEVHPKLSCFQEKEDWLSQLLPTGPLFQPQRHPCGSWPDLSLLPSFLHTWGG